MRGEIAELCPVSLPATNAKRLRKGAKRGSNPFYLVPTNGLLRGACHRARIRATGWLAMTIAGLFLVLVRLLAADGFQLGEHRIDVEIVAALFRGLQLRLLAGGLRGRQ
jgi:hypothetical protein